MFSAFIEMFFSNPLWMGLLGGLLAAALYILSALGLLGGR